AHPSGAATQPLPGQGASAANGQRTAVLVAAILGAIVLLGGGIAASALLLGGDDPETQNISDSAGSAKDANGSKGGDSPQASAADRREARERRLRSFVRDVDPILERSRPGRQEITELAGGIRSGALTVGEARTKMASVISNRESVLADTDALDPPTKAAGRSQRLLAESFRASLENDRDFQDAIDAAEVSDVATFLQEAFNDTVVSSNAATEAKDQFVAAFNELRAEAGVSGQVTNDF
ncbi:MAG: hypothetical protein ACR2NA_07455, partial [Solirubrobacterales bacterium]